RGERKLKRYKKLWAELKKKREVKKVEFYERTVECLKKILPKAKARGVKLGIKNRQSLEELPLDADFDLLFREISSPNLVYWHDTGHAQIKENLGFIHHALHLESRTGQLAGFHLHDVQFPGRDHCAPGTGTIDFAALKPMVRPEHIKVFEFSPGLSVDEAKRGIDHLKKNWGPE